LGKIPLRGQRSISRKRLVCAPLVSALFEQGAQAPCGDGRVRVARELTDDAAQRADRALPLAGRSGDVNQQHQLLGARAAEHAFEAACLAQLERSSLVFAAIGQALPPWRL